MNSTVRRARRRGAVLLIVLTFLSVTLAVSYAFIRTESTEIAIGVGQARWERARSAALSGAMFALQDLRSATWTGVDTTVRKNLGDGSAFEISYQAGDPSVLGTADEGEYPFRVVVDIRGIAAPGNAAGAEMVHRMRLVVQLIRRALSPEPVSFERFNHRSVLQWDGGEDVKIEWPVRIEGPTEFQGPLKFFEKYPADTNPLVQYMYDLERMRQAGRGDFRPFESLCRIGPAAQGTRGHLILENLLNVDVANIGVADTPNLVRGAFPATYQLYPGGPSYTIPVLSSTIRHQTLGPDVTANPLGIYRYTRSVTVKDRVASKGTWLGNSASLRFRGTDITVQPLVLPPLVDDATSYALPTISAEGAVRFRSRGSIAVEGFVHSESKIRIEPGANSERLDIRGRLATSRLEIQRRNDWPTSKSWWETALSDWGQSNHPYFPEYLAEHEQLSHDAPITIKPPTGGVRYHWQDWTLPIYGVHPDDSGLQWTLVRWETDVPP